MDTQSLKLLLKSSQLPVREYVRHLELENAKLQKQIAKLECTNMSHKNKIAALKKELNKDLKKGHLTVIVNRNVGKNS
jgi:predicted RNase H-like nuclease (RuvC/YqgF family)